MGDNGNVGGNGGGVDDRATYIGVCALCSALCVCVVCFIRIQPFLSDIIYWVTKLCNFETNKMRLDIFGWLTQLPKIHCKLSKTSEELVSTERISHRNMCINRYTEGEREKERETMRDNVQLTKIPTMKI